MPGVPALLMFFFLSFVFHYFQPMRFRMALWALYGLKAQYLLLRRLGDEVGPSGVFTVFVVFISYLFPYVILYFRFMLELDYCMKNGGNPGIGFSATQFKEPNQ